MQTGNRIALGYSRGLGVEPSNNKTILPSCGKVKGLNSPSCKLHHHYVETNWMFFSFSLASQSKAMAAINAAFADYKKNTCIAFKKRTNEQAYVSFFRGKG